MTRLTRNIGANLVGGIWNSAIAILFIPVYLRYLGVEAYGLVGFSATLQAIFALFDLGLGATLNRGMARLSVSEKAEQRQRDLLRTFEIIYYSVAVVLGVVVFLAAPGVARHWIHVQHLAPEQVAKAIRLIAVMGALQFPFALYQSALLGLQQQILLNVTSMVSSTIRAGGAVLVLVFLSRSIVGFFAWQALMTLWQTFMLFGLIWRVVGGPLRARFNAAILAAEWRFAAKVSANSIVGALLTQADKIILSGVAPLKDLGYYTLAGTVAGALLFLIHGVGGAVYPRFSQLLAAADERTLANVFHKASQTVALLVLPGAVTLALFSVEVVQVWTRDPVTSRNTASIVPLLAAGAAMYGLCIIPTYLQLAAGWPQLTLYANLISAAVLIPTVVYTTRMFGATGAALLPLVLNANYFVPATAMFRRVIREERSRWYGRDVGAPLFAASAVGIVGRFLAPTDAGRLATGMYLVVIAGAIFVAVFTVCPDLRRDSMDRLRTFLGSRAVDHGGVDLS